MSEQYEKDLKRLEILREELEGHGYLDLTVIEGRGICGIQPYMFTFGICSGLTNVGYFGRWCYPRHITDAFLALAIWDGKEDPPGDWVKYKGQDGERWNPKKEYEDN